MLIKRIKWNKLIRPRLLFISISILAAGALLLFIQPNTNNSDVNIKNADVNKLAREYLSDCRNSQCLGQKLKEITVQNGPSVAIESLQLYEKLRLNSSPVDFHLMAHEIGRQIAETSGSGGDAFLSCPTGYNYGCQHGFFEKVLGKSASPKEAITRICGNIETDPAYSTKFKYYCYHGVGHGVMMAQAYDLYASLGICDSLTGQIAQVGCWQGVFMENVNGQVTGDARKGIFSEDDPLAPCSSMAEKYQQQCYLNHSGYLFSLFNNNVDKAIQTCMKAGNPHADNCLQGIGLAATSEVWQKILLNKNPSTDVEATGWELCQKFPSSHVQSCILGGVSHILQMDRFELKRADKFCSIVNSSYKEACYQRVGETLKSESLNAQIAVNHCKQLPSIWQTTCQRGAGQL